MKNKKSILLIILFVLCGVLGFFATGQRWKSDRFLQGYQETTVSMSNDYSGTVTSTIIRRESPCGGDKAILYIHGYNDYFFQKELGDTFVDSCWNFYAVDLRKYGRSLQPDQIPYQMRNIKEYYADIDSALQIMANRGIKEVVLIGHSTGGLVVCSYMNNHPSDMIQAVILNSPFLDWNMSPFIEKFAIPMVTCIGRRFPNLQISQGDISLYGESLLKDYHGEWTFDTELKTIKPRKVSAGWIRGITLAQRALRDHSFIKVPVLLMRSAKSIYGNKWSEEFHKGDAVLDVNDISRYGRTLGPDVTELIVKGGLHDLILSEPQVREAVYSEIFRWLRANAL